MRIDEIIPNNVNQIVNENGIWENSVLTPLYLSAFEVNYKGENMFSYQVEFHCNDKLGKVNQLLEKNEIELDGYGWEMFIRKFLKEKNDKFENRVIGDSEAETCVLWVKNVDDYKVLIKNLLSFSNLEFN
mgnify:FL=1